VREFFLENWGNLASVVGLLVSLGALFFARSAAETAKLVRREMQRYNLHEYLASIAARFQEFLLLMRLAKWEIAQVRAVELSMSLTWVTSKWEIILGPQRKNRLDNTCNLLRQIIMKLNESDPRGPDEEIKKDLLSSAELALEQVIKTQGEISQELETTGVKYER